MSDPSALLGQSGLARIRDYYGVPARRGMRVRLGRGYEFEAGREGVILGSTPGAMTLRVRLDDDRHALVVHPTWNLDYLMHCGCPIR